MITIDDKFIQTLFSIKPKSFHPLLFHRLNQTQMRKTKDFSILPLFSILLPFYPPNQTYPKSLSSPTHLQAPLFLNPAIATANHLCHRGHIS